MPPWRRVRAASIALLGFLLAFHAPLPARAAGSAEVRTYLTSIERLYQGLEYERALEQIASARRVAQGVEDDVILSLYEGIILADMRKQEASTTAFKSALLLNPDAKLPILVSPKVRQRFERLRKVVKKELATAQAKREASSSPANVEPPSSPATPEPQADEDSSPAADSAPVVSDSVSSPTRSSATTEVSSSAHSGLRSRALIPVVAGGVLLVAGGVSYGLAKKEQSRLSKGAGEFDSFSEAQSSASRGRTWQTVGFGLAAAGVVGLGIAAAMYALGAPSESLAFGIGVDGRSAMVTGRWP